MAIGSLVVGVEFDRAERGPRGTHRIAYGAQLGGKSDEFDGPLLGEELFLLGDGADATTNRSVGSGIRAEHIDAALGWWFEAAEHPQHRGLARSIRTEQRRDPGPQREAHVGDGHHIAEPFRDVVDGDSFIAGRGWRWREWRWRWWQSRSLRHLHPSEAECDDPDADCTDGGPHRDRGERRNTLEPVHGFTENSGRHIERNVRRS